MITRQLNVKTLHRIPRQRSKTFKNFHSVRHEDQLFDKTPKPNLVFVHHSLLKSLHQNRHYEALGIFKKHLEMGIANIDEVAIAIAVKACRGDPKLGCQIHGFAITTGFMSYLSVSNSLMNIYCKSGQLNRASSILENLDNPDIVSYNTLLSGFENGEDALSFACGIHSVGVVFDAVTYTTI
ncbi:unnamed protein product, partial [Ilex paraguariensis]